VDGLNIIRERVTDKYSCDSFFKMSFQILFPILLIELEIKQVEVKLYVYIDINLRVWYWPGCRRSVMAFGIEELGSMDFQ